MELETDALPRLLISLAVLITLLIVEHVWPRRERVAAQGRRLVGNLCVALLNGLVLRFLLAAWLPVVAALAAAEQGWGLLNLLGLGLWFDVVVSVILLDFLIYWQHRLFHRVPLLWRLHRMHHTDVDIDVTTAFRFHPVEIVLSALIKSIAVLVLGAPVAAVLIFEAVLNLVAQFNHSNLKLPLGLDKYLRKLVVTPDMHRVHHSVLRQEHDSNFGFNLSCWDRWLGSYQAQPERGHHKMIVGLNETNAQPVWSVWWMLINPFK